MRNGHAIANRGRAKLLALLQNLENRTFALAAQSRRARGEFLQGLLLAGDRERRHHGIRRDKIGKRHGTVRGSDDVSDVDVLERRGP